MSSQNNSEAADGRSVSVSPVPTNGALPSSRDDAAEEDMGHFSDQLLDPVSGEPPRNAYTFNIPNDEGEISGQVFSYITLFRLIGTPGEGDAKYFVYHPITRERIRRDKALASVLPVSIEIQERINQQRCALGLEDVDIDHLTQEDHRKYTETITAVARHYAEIEAAANARNGAR